MRLPTRASAALWRGKVTLLQLQRVIQDMVAGLPRHPCHALDPTTYPVLLAESRTPLWSDETIAERRLQLGKVQNLRTAVRAWNGLTVPAGEVLSFWRQLGRATKRRGYTLGRELREGCIIPAIGGGLCQLSNALYEVALRADLEIVERHPHTARVPGSAAALGRDATVFWNHIDLRLRASISLQWEVRLTQTELIVRLHSAVPITRPTPTRAPRPKFTLSLLDPTAHGCVSCGQDACFRHNAPATIASRSAEERTAYLVEECWPEYRRYIQENREKQDTLALPLDGKRWLLPRYGWDTSGFSHIETATWVTLRRSVEARRLSGHAPAQVRAAQLAGAERLARALATRALPAEVTHACVAQALLPYLWRDGYLGGRTFDVLMTRLPLDVLQSRLDDAFALHPDRTLLGDFRAPADLVAAETEALAAATRIITPHAEIAALFGSRAVLLPWQMLSPPAVLPARGTAIAFPGPTAARKGAYEVREAARALDLEVVLCGSELEGIDFWRGIRTRRADRNGYDWLKGVAAVVQPSLVEDRPRPLLAALAAGVPVLATPGCGLGNREGVVTIPSLDADALIAALSATLLARNR